METVKINTSQHVDIDYPVAGLGERIAARLIDLGCFLGVYLLLILFLFLSSLLDSLGTWFAIVMGVFVATYVFYNLICEIFMNGQSIGKKLMKIKVVSLDGAQASTGQYFIRWVFRLADFIFTAQVGGLICIALSNRKQRIGDIVAGTTVVKTVPATKLEHIAFHPVEEEYTPLFQQATELSDVDMELIHEVITTYYRTQNADPVYAISSRISNHLSLTLPEGMNEMDFLKALIKDYSYLTAKYD